MTKANPNLVPMPVKGSGDTSSLDVMSQMLLKLVDGNSSIETLIDRTGLDADIVERICGNLSAQGFIFMPGADADAVGAVHVEPTAEQTELEREIESVLSSAENSNYYKLLGVAPDVPRSQIRAKYFDLSKRYHPDKAFKQNAELRQKMGVLFRRYTDAYDVLSRSESRKEYDESIQDELSLWAIEKNLKDAFDEESKPSSDSPAAEPPPPKPEQTESEPPRSRSQPIISSFPSRPPPARQSSSPPRAERRSGPSVRRRSSQPAHAAQVAPGESHPAAQRASSRDTQSDPPRSPSDAPRSSNSDHALRRQQWKRERAGRAMAAILKRNSLAPGPVPSAKQLESAKVALEAERFAEAVRLFESVLAQDPENAEANNLVDKARLGAAEAEAKDRMSLGMHAVRQGRVDVAMNHFQVAAQLDPNNLDARHLLADTLLNQHRDLPTALNLIKEVIGMGGKRPRYFATLGELLFLAQDFDRAYEAFKRALTLEPDNKEYKKRLKACKR